MVRPEPSVFKKSWRLLKRPPLVDGIKFALVPGPLLHGLAVTLQISAVSLVLAFALGLAIALFRLSSSPVARALARGYLECIRNTPLLVQLLFIYFVLAPVLDLSRFTAAVLALSLFEGAYGSEIFRAAILSVHRGQWEAAHALGLTSFHTYRYVILPQAISLVKDSALVSTIAIYDLTMQAQALISETYLTFQVWLTVTALSFILTLTLSLSVRRVEVYLSRGEA